MSDNAPDDESLRALALLDPALIDTNGPEGLLQSLVLKGDLNSLTLDQKRMLSALISLGNNEQAFAFTGITKTRHAQWLRTNVVYGEAVNAIGNGLLLQSQAHLTSLYPKAAEALEDGLDAEKWVTVEVTCPQCGHEHKTRVNVADLKLRVDVAKSLFTRSGDLGTSRLKVSGRVEHDVTTISLEDRMVLEKIRRGLPVPGEVLASLRQRGIGPLEPQAGADTEDQHSPPAGAIDAQYRDLDPDVAAPTD
jgi:hypothetical protein